MTNLIILLIVWCTGIVLVYAWMLARSLRRAFREEITVEPAEEHLASAPAEGRILSYAKPPAKPHLTRRWPILSALGAGGMVPLMAVPTFPVLAMAFARAIPQAATVCVTALGLTLPVITLVTCLGLREVGGRPAAAGWRWRGWAVLCWVAVLVLTWIGLDWRVQRILDAALTRTDLLGRELEISSRDGSAAAAIYQQAGVGLRKAIDFDDQWELVAADGRVSVPPPFPDAHAFRIPLLRQAAAMETSGLIAPASQYSLQLLLPHLAGMRQTAALLRLHAIAEARAGRIESAIADINTIRRMADHTQQGLTLVEMLVGAGMRAIANDTLQHVLPMVKDPRTLELIQLEDPAQCMPAARRCIQGELGVMDRRSLVMVLRGQANFSTASPSAVEAGAIAAYKVVLSENDVAAMDEYASQLPAMIPDDPAVAAGLSATVNAKMMSARSRGLIIGILVPTVGRTIDCQVESAAMTELSRASVAATRFRLQQGRLPGSFEELVQAGLLPAVPVDPFNRKAMRFVVHKDCVFIYTIGRNRTDNGGSPFILTKSGDIVQSNPGFILSDRLLWELDLVPPGFVPATQESEPQ